MQVCMYGNKYFETIYICTHYFTYKCMFIQTYISHDHGVRDELCSCISVHQQQQQLCFCFVFVLNAILPFLTHLLPFSYMARLAYVLKPESVRLWVAEPLCYTKWQMHFVHTHLYIHTYVCSNAYISLYMHILMCVYVCALHCNFFIMIGVFLLHQQCRYVCMRVCKYTFKNICVSHRLMFCKSLFVLLIY